MLRGPLRDRMSAVLTVMRPPWFGRMVLGVLLAIVLSTGLRPERLGDRFQVALPILALGCQAANGQAGEYLLRYAVLWTGIRAGKNLLADAPLNMRPNGGSGGMPSGHMATAAFGASTLAHDCLAGSMPGRLAAIVAAGFTGASRMNAGAHTIWQVLMGTLWGLLCDRLLRRHPAGRRRVRVALRRLGEDAAMAARRVRFRAMGQRSRGPRLRIRR